MEDEGIYLGGEIVDKVDDKYNIRFDDRDYGDSLVTKRKATTLINNYQNEKFLGKRVFTGYDTLPVLTHDSDDDSDDDSDEGADKVYGNIVKKVADKYEIVWDLQDSENALVTEEEAFDLMDKYNYYKETGMKPGN